ncbi:MAG: hypothetical protein AAF902_17835 [Chloroflexota bacterium]
MNDWDKYSASINIDPETNRVVPHKAKEKRLQNVKENLDRESLLDDQGMVNISAAISNPLSNVMAIQTSYTLKPAVHKHPLELIQKHGQVSQATQIVKAVKRPSVKNEAPANKLPQILEPTFPTVKLQQFDGRASAKKAQKSRQITMYLVLASIIASVLLFGIAPAVIGMVLG